MKLEQQVVSLDLSKRLKELGFKQDSLFYYERGLNKNNLLENYYLRYEKTNGISDNAYISAYTVAELGEILPNGITEEENYYSCWYEKNGEDWCAFTSRHCNKRDKNLANAMAKMLIYLKENDLI